MSRERILILSLAIVSASAFLAANVVAQAPSGPTNEVDCKPQSRLRGKLRHTFHVLQDNFIGYPDQFVEPPVGFYVNQSFTTMKAKADPHKFTLYKSDFLAGTSQLSPVGASRFNLMATRLPGWIGPITIEWSPDEPALALARRAAVVDYLQASQLPVSPERVVIGPSRYPGTYGNDAANFYGNLSIRNQAAGSIFSLSPTQFGNFGSGGGR